MDEPIIFPNWVKKQIIEMLRKNQMIKEEGYRCGQCAAFPCFRYPSIEERAGLCFQATRRCRQECDLYSHTGYPREGGFCKITGKEVRYEQDCHVSERKGQIKV